MKNWEYFELTTALYSSYFSYREQGDTSEQAIGKMGLDFWFYPESENILQNLLLIIVSISMSISPFNKINTEKINVFEKQLLLINEELLNKELKQNEKENLKELIDDILFKIKAIKNDL